MIKQDPLKYRAVDHKAYAEQHPEEPLIRSEDLEAAFDNRPMDYLPIGTVDEVPTILGPAELLNWLSAFVEAGSKGVGAELDKATVAQINEVALVQMQSMFAWEHMFWKGSLPDIYNESLFYSESTLLPITNKWWNDNLARLQPCIVSCKHSMQICNNLDAIMKADRTDDQMIEMLVMEYRKRFDFLAWIVLVATNNMSAYLQARVAFGKYACKFSNELLTTRYHAKLDDDEKRDTPKGQKSKLPADYPADELDFL